MSSRDNRPPTLLQQMGKRIEVPFQDGPSLTLPVSWLTLQVILFLVVSLVCSCCATSSYLWGNLSPYLTAPAFTRSIAIPTYAARKSPASTPIDSDQPSVTPRAAETTTRPAQSPSPTPDSPLQPTSSSPPPTPTSTPRPTTPATLPSSSQPTPTRPSLPTPTGTPRPSTATTNLFITDVIQAPFPSESGGDEHIVVKNEGPGDQDMTGWSLTNERLRRYWFPAGFLLPANTSVRVWTKSGTDTQGDLYWGSEEEIWDDQDGIAYLRDPGGNLVDLHQW